MIFQSDVLRRLPKRVERASHASDASPGNTAKMGMYIGHDMNEQIDYNKARFYFTPEVS
jgi:hypothetical protein